MPKASTGSIIGSERFCSSGGSVLYYSFNSYLRHRFGERIQKITLDAGLTCPNRDGTKGTDGCLYCNSRGSGTGASAQKLSIREQVALARNVLTRRYKAGKFIAYFQSFCNTYAPVPLLKSLYDEALSVPDMVGLSIATRPDCLTPEVLELLSTYTERYMVWLELGLQTIHDRTLALINRGHSWQDFLEGYRRARSYPLLVCVHVIIGLPGEQRDDVRKTAHAVGMLRPDGVKIHSLYISKGTGMEKLYQKGAYKPLEQGEFVAAACDMIEALPPQTIIQRVTGDPDPAELVAPEWTLRKQETIGLIREELKRRGSKQGSNYCPSSE